MKKFEGTIEKRRDGCYTVTGILDGKQVCWVLSPWELKEVGKLTKKNILEYLRKHPEKR